MSSAGVRAARLDEVSTLAWIEDEAGRMYAQVGLPPDLEGLSLDVLREGVEQGLLWVWADDDDRPVAFAMCWRRPDSLHLRELDVLPTHHRRGLGRVLIEYVCDRARAESRAHVTLTTFADVPWNAPLYRRYGFETLDEAALPPWLTAIRRSEQQSGLDTWPRVAMARKVAIVG